MDAIMQMIVPILIATVLSFILSALIWMVFPHHKTDWDKTLDVSFGNAAEGQYVVPKDHATADWHAFIFIKRGRHNMGKALGLQFLSQLFVSAAIGYLVYHTTPQGTEYLQIFRVAGTAALLAYGGALAQRSIWWGWRWSVTWKDLFDAVLYALVVGGSFAFYWNG